MCDHCREMKDELKEAIRQLVEREGELYDELRQVAEEEFEDETLREDALDSIIAEGIAQRAAFMASYCTGTALHNVPPAIILGSWAAELMNAEIAINEGRHMRNLLGLGDN